MGDYVVVVNCEKARVTGAKHRQNVLPPRAPGGGLLSELEQLIEGARACDSACREGDDAPQPPGPRDAEETEGLCRPSASPRCSAAAATDDLRRS